MVVWLFTLRGGRGFASSPVSAALRAFVAGAAVSLFLALRATLSLVPPTDPQIAGIVPQTSQGEREPAQGARIDSPLQSHPTDSSSDDDCIFRNSTLYRKVYVYPSRGTPEYAGSAALSVAAARAASSSTALPEPWPWIEHDRQARASNASHYDVDSHHVQYSTELLVRELFTNPNSCLRTDDPEVADLFYVPYLPSTEFHRGTKDESTLDYTTSPYGLAILDILTSQNYTSWESPTLFGLTSKYWKRRGGRDHILVFSEPFHGLVHARYKRGSYHYLHSQQQLSSAIVLSVEVSKTFVEAHPKCAAKNVLLPYPNTDGRWFNGAFDKEARHLARAAMKQLPRQSDLPTPPARPATLYLSAGIHGRCKRVRRALEQDYRSCSSSYMSYHANVTRLYRHGMRISTFCPAPGGDSPSSKRMFDCLHAGSIPVVLSRDFVWPFTSEIMEAGPTNAVPLSPDDFSIRLDATDYSSPALDPRTCQVVIASRPSLDMQMDAIPGADVARWQRGAARMSDLYSWYRRRSDLPDRPLREGVLPDGGAAHQLVRMLEVRAAGEPWRACAEEQKQQQQPIREANQFKC